MCEMVCQSFQKKQEEKRIEEEQAVNARFWKIPACCNDDDDYDYAITPEETDNSPNEVIKSSVEDLVLIPSESEGILDTMCDVHLVNNSTPLEAKNHFEIVINSNDDNSSSDDDSLYKENIEYVEVSPYDSELVSLEAAEIVIPEKEEIDDDNFHEKLLNEFADELAHIISPPEYDSFYFWNLPDPGELMSILNSGICENLPSTTCVNLLIEDDHSPLLTYVVWIFLAYLTLVHLAGSQPMLKSSYKAKASVIISIPPLVGGVADVVDKAGMFREERLKNFDYIPVLYGASNT
nr:hypothetical protein [Tanacetum cinerariifolium]